MITPKGQHRLLAVTALVSAAVSQLLIFLPTRTKGRGHGPLFVLSLIFLCYHWYRFKKTPTNAVFYDIRTRPLPEQIDVSTRAIWVFAIIGPLLSWWTFRNLSALEHGTVPYVQVWAPIGFIYDLLGLWPAALCLPVLFGFGIAALALRIEKAKSALNRPG